VERHPQHVLAELLKPHSFAVWFCYFSPIFASAEQSGAEQSVNYSMSIVEKLQMKFN